mmetsp:Transcript_24128/g.50937  ORF Transcript_24128/g.50937 Transcript_24128/m.50937 type:complete len:103 (-) Transcript_24128:27-335(-)
MLKALWETFCSNKDFLCFLDIACWSLVISLVVIVVGGVFGSTANIVDFFGETGNNNIAQKIWDRKFIHGPRNASMRTKSVPKIFFFLNNKYCSIVLRSLSQI